VLLLPRLRVGTSTARFLCAFLVRWRSHRPYRGSRSTLTWARSLFKIFGAMGCLGSRHGNILFHVPFFLSSRFSFSGVLFFRMGSWPAVKRVIYPVSCMTGSCTLWEFQSLRFTWCLFFFEISLIVSSPLFYSSPVRHRAKLDMSWPLFWPCNPDIELLSDIY
jgi:hypothetical protein